MEGFLELCAVLTGREQRGFDKYTWLMEGLREFGAVLTAWKEKSNSPTSFLTSLGSVSHIILQTALYSLTGQVSPRHPQCI